MFSCVTRFHLAFNSFRQELGLLTLVEIVTWYPLKTHSYIRLCWTLCLPVPVNVYRPMWRTYSPHTEAGHCTLQALIIECWKFRLWQHWENYKDSKRYLYWSSAHDDDGEMASEFAHLLCLLRFHSAMQINCLLVDWLVIDLKPIGI